MSSMMFLNRAGARGIRSVAQTQQMRTAATLATFKTPKVFNEPNHHYAKGSDQREGLTAAIEKLQKKLPIEVPVVVGGKQVSFQQVKATARTLPYMNSHRSRPPPSPSSRTLPTMPPLSPLTTLLPPLMFRPQ